LPSKGGVLIRLPVKPDLFERPVGRFHQLPNRLENRGDFLVMPFDSPLQLGKLAGQFAVCPEYLAELNKCAHDLRIHEDSAFAAQHVGKHGNTLLGKRARRVAAATPLT
jgi:hypothetical protein